MATRYTFTDDSDDVRLSGFLTPEPAGTFNGGTITTPLGINTDPGDVTLSVFPAVGQTADLADFISAAAGSVEILADGGINQNTNNAMSNDALGIGISNALAVNVVNVSQAFSPFATVWRINKSGYMGLRLHAAPADGDVATGEAMLWFDQTNGAATLMVKAKQADGTVKVGRVTVALPTSGALPTVQLVTATGAQILTSRDTETITPCTFNPGAATTATVTVALSPDNVTYSTLGVETVPAGVALDGTIHLVKVRVPAGWYLKLTVNAQATLGLTTYY